MFIGSVLSKYIVETKFEDFPQEVVKKAKECLFDSLGVTLAGSLTPSGRIYIDFARYRDGRSESTLLGTKYMVSCLAASYANSLMANAMDYDDVSANPIGHPGATIIPPAIAVGERVHASGKELLTSVVVGYELELRIGDAIQPTPERRDKVYGHGTWQTFGAVTSAGKLLNLSQDQMENAIGLAGSNAPVPSLWKAKTDDLERTQMTKNNYGYASEVGVSAALHAQRGFMGPLDILDGDLGFWRMCGSDRCDFDRMTERLGEEYKILGVIFKRYPCCAWIHPSLDAALSIIKENKINVKDIEKINVRTFKYATRNHFNNPIPNNIYHATCSTKYNIAATIAGVKRSMQWQSNDTLKNPQILELAKKVNLVEDPEATKAYDTKPQRMLSAVEINAKGRRYINKSELRYDAKYDPMPDAKEKFRVLASGVINPRYIEKIIDMIYELEKVNDIIKLMKLFR